MIKRKGVLLLAVAAALVSCGRGDYARIRIDASSADDSTMVVLSRLNINKTEIIDTLYLKEGKADCRIDMRGNSPQFLYLSFPGTTLSLLAGTGENIEVRLAEDGSKGVTGSDESVLLQSVEVQIGNFNKRFGELSSKLSHALDSGDAGSAEKYRKELGALYVERKREAIEYIYNHPKSLTVIPVLYQKIGDLPIFADATDAILMGRIYDSLSVSYPGSPYLVALAEEMEYRHNMMEMEMKLEAAQECSFPNITLTDINGEQKDLSETVAENRVTALIFWDASNVEQRTFSTELKSLYEKYEQRGFEIFQVALNTDKTEWALQIKQQKLPWINLIDRAAASSVNAAHYNVTELPALFLISNGGDIVGKDIYEPKSLEQVILKQLR